VDLIWLLIFNSDLYLSGAWTSVDLILDTKSTWLKRDFRSLCSKFVYQSRPDSQRSWRIFYDHKKNIIHFENKKYIYMILKNIKDIGYGHNMDFLIMLHIIQEVDTQLKLFV
jgi:hypothetical protein